MFHGETKGVYKEMNKVDEFYRGKEILSKIESWRQPLKVVVKENHIEIWFEEKLGNEFSKNEKQQLFEVLKAELLWSYRGGGGIEKYLIARLWNSLQEIKKEIKRNFDIKEVN